MITTSFLVIERANKERTDVKIQIAKPKHKHNAGHKVVAVSQTQVANKGLMAYQYILHFNL
jgi:hypothetical protein